MSARRRSLRGSLHGSLLWIGLGVLVGVLLFAFRPPVRALPEYMTRTGEACAACHVNPAGGGPLTERGSLWVAAGKPNRVPPQPANDEAASAAAEGEDQPAKPETEGADLYVELACDACHGPAGEGASAPALDRGKLTAGELSRVTRNGKGPMPGYSTKRLSDADLAALVRYVQAMGRDDAPAQPNGKPEGMEPVSTTCGSGAQLDGGSPQACDGN